VLTRLLVGRRGGETENENKSPYSVTNHILRGDASSVGIEVVLDTRPDTARPVVVFPNEYTAILFRSCHVNCLSCYYAAVRSCGLPCNPSQPQ
jgi:hypothetical protein